MSRDSDDNSTDRSASGAAARSQDADPEAPDPRPDPEPTVGEDPLEQAKKEAAANYDRFLRAEAELQNVLRRHERDRSERVKYAAESLGRDLLDVVDDLERALQHADSAEGVTAALTEGVKLVRERLLAVLERHGIERIVAKGRPFDPNEHEAVALVETDEHGSNVVVDEHRPGYKIHDRLLRPAMVAVSRPASGRAANADSAESEGK